MSGSYNTLSGQLNAILLRLNTFIATCATLAGNNIFTGLNTFTQSLTLQSDINGGGEAGQVLTSQGADLPVYWSNGGGGLIGTLFDVLLNGNVASRDILMNNKNITNADNVDCKSVSLTTTLNTNNITSSRSSIPITINGTVYYLQLFQNT